METKPETGGIAMATKNSMTKSIGIQVTSRRLFELCTSAAFNEFKIKLGGIPYSYNDTEATYELVCDEKLTKPRHAELVTFLRGVIVCFRIM